MRRTTLVSVVALAVGARGDCAPLPLGEKIRWLHVPKTGSSFSMTLAYYLCPTIPLDANTSVRGGAVWPRLWHDAPGAERFVISASFVRACARNASADRAAERGGAARLPREAVTRLDFPLSFGHSPLVYYDAPPAGAQDPRRWRKAHASGLGRATPWAERLQLAGLGPPSAAASAPPPPPRAAAPNVSAALAARETLPSVTLLRRPRARVISAYFDSRRTDCQLEARDATKGCCHQCVGPDNESLERLRRELNANYSDYAHLGPRRIDAAASQIYAAWPGLRGCATRLLTGRPCNAASAALGPDDAALAIARLRRDFAFVGLTEHFDVSVCLFGAMFGGAFSEANMLQNYRPSAHTAHLERLLPDYVDEHDDAVYAEAERLFAAQLRAHGHCARNELCRRRIEEHVSRMDAAAS